MERRTVNLSFDYNTETGLGHLVGEETFVVPVDLGAHLQVRMGLITLIS